MTTIPQDKALQRWDTLPDSLHQAIFSEPNADFVWKTCESEHIPDEKIYDAATLTSYVLLGFIHPEDLGEELKEALAIDAKVAASIADAINKRIFAPLRADIDKMYQPVSKMDVLAGPKIIQDIATQPISLEKVTGGPSFSLSGTPTGPTKPPAAAEAGWSKRAPEDPILKFNTPTAVQSSTGPTTLKPIASSIIPPKPTVTMGPMGEFARRAMSSSTPTPPSSPIGTTATTTTKASEPAPVMLHQDTTFKAAEKNIDFHLARPEDGSQMQSTPSKAGASMPLKAAVLELGNIPAGTAKPPAAAATQPSRMVHYTDFKVPGERNITEITAPIATPIATPAAPAPKPSMQAAPPMSGIPTPPKPPTMPMTSMGQPPAPSVMPPPPKPAPPVIKKDYL